MVDLFALTGNVLLFALVFGMSATVDVKCMKAQMNNRKAIMAGIVCQFIVLPLLGFLVVNMLDLDHDMGITLLVVTSSPGGSYSNWWCSVFNADLALSVTMTAISTILSIAILPLNLLLYTKYSYDDDVISKLDWYVVLMVCSFRPFMYRFFHSILRFCHSTGNRPSLFTALFIVILAIAIGLYCSYKIKSFEFNKRANQLGNAAGLALIAFSALVTNTGDADSKIWSRDWSFYVGVSLPCILGLIIANVIGTMCNLKKPERVYVDVC